MTPAKIAWPGLLLACAALGAAPPQEGALREPALAALKKAATFYHDKVSRHGGYVYYTSLDLTERWGEGKAAPDTIFVQPPGTPTVGMALLDAHAATGDPFYLEAARDAARALVQGQLESGGWTQVIAFGSDVDKDAGKYRQRKGGRRNTSSLDDGQTQSALLMLIRTDRALDFRDAEIHEAALFGLGALLRAQFANGAFPQVWTGPVPARPVVRAQYPTYDWRTEGRIKNYWDQYTLNDGLAGTVARTLIEAHRVYRDETYRHALETLGDFLVLAQMPDPQPAWCQQYNEAMVPIWARKFEPPAVTGWESQDVMETLIAIARYTGKTHYLEPIPRALAYLRTCLLPDGRVARYYELKTNRPLYMDARYRLTHDDSDVPIHYGWKQPARLDAIEAAYRDASAVKSSSTDARPPAVSALEPAARRAIAELDDQGRWVSTYAGERLVGQPRFRTGFRYLSSERFRENVEALTAYLLATSRRGRK